MRSGTQFFMSVFWGGMNIKFQQGAWDARNMPLDVINILTIIGGGISRRILCIAMAYIRDFVS